MKLKLIKLGTVALFSMVLMACSSNGNSGFNRVCNPIKSAEQFSLSSDALFAFDSATINSVNGKDNLDTLISQVNNKYTQIDSITIVGHTDRIGSDNYNDRLGLERAQAVKNYLVNKGLNTTYYVETRGKRDPITTNCSGTTATAALKACLSPDRRVTLSVHGVKR